MTDTKAPAAGTIGWTDLTVQNADAIRDFYARVVGWTITPLDMGGYSDYLVLPPGSDQPIAGICHARGSNADIPPQWLIYIIVQDVEVSAAECVRSGGVVLTHPRGLSGGRFCVITDPAGAVCALFQPPAG